MEILISVIIPVYNCEKYLSRAVSSIISQPESDSIEVIIIDDGSVDGTAAVADELSSQHNNVSVIHKQNGGVSSARNLGMEKATGKYLAFLDADDWWENGFFDTEMKHNVIRDNYDVYSFSYKYISGNGKYSNLNAEKDNYTFDKNGLKKYMFKHPCSFLYRRMLIKQNSFQFLNCSIREDIPFLNFCLYFATSFKQCEKVIFNYWMNPQSCLHSHTSSKKALQTVISMNMEKEEYIKRNVDYNNERDIVSTLIECLPRICSEQSYKKTVEFMQNDLFRSFNDGQIMPWSYLIKGYNLWKKSPFIFWLKSRLFPGIPINIIDFLYIIPFTRNFADWLWCRVIRKWEKVS